MSVTSDTTVRAEPHPAGPTRLWTLRPGTTCRRLFPIAAAAAVLLLWAGFLYKSSLHTREGNSDNANAVLAGHDLFNGNLLLRDWVLPVDTYWTIDLPIYGLFTAVWGVGPEAMYAVPVFIGVAAILVGARIAHKAERRGWLGAGVVVLLLGLPHDFLRTFFFQGPHHVGTTLLCLFSFLLLGGPTRRRRFLALALLGAAVLGDAFSLAIGVAPMLAAGLISALRRRRWEPVVAFGGVGALAVGGAALAHILLEQARAYELAPPLQLGTWNWGNNLRAVPRLLGSLLGVGSDSGLSGLGQAAHVPGTLAFAAGVGVTTILVLAGALRASDRRLSPLRWGPGPTWLDDVLVMGFWGGIGAYVMVALPPNGPDTSRYLLPSLVYGAVLAGRRATMVKAARTLPHLVPPVVALVLFYFATSASALRHPPAANPIGELAQWLKLNNLEAGFGQYWSASIITVKSEEAVTVRPVVAINGRLHADPYYASSDWFETAGEPARRFLVYLPGDPPLGDVDDRSARATFGEPSKIEQVGRYQVLIWDTDVSSLLGPAQQDA